MIYRFWGYVSEANCLLRRLEQTFTRRREKRSAGFPFHSRRRRELIRCSVKSHRRSTHFTGTAISSTCLPERSRSHFHNSQSVRLTGTVKTHMDCFFIPKSPTKSSSV